MTSIKQKTSALFEQSRGAFHKLTTGGDWALSHSAATRRNLTWFWLDGFFASASDNIIGTYLVIYILALGANQSQIGLMSALSSLSAAALLLPGAMLVERMGRRRPIVLIGGGWARLALLFIAAVPLFIKSPLAIFVIIGLSVTRDAMANLSYPAWMAMTGDIVPLEGRGRFFSSRNFIMGLSGMVMTFLAGVLISSSAQPAGYQVAILVACAIGSLSVFSFSRLTDRPRPLAYTQAQPRLALGSLLRDMTTHREFLFFAATTALWNFSLNIAGPFFNVFLVKNLHADATMIGLTSISSSLAAMLAQRKLGDLNDRWGARRLTMICGLLIPIVPLLWVFATAAWHVIFINLLSGLLWGGYNLASFNYLLMVTPEDRRARYSALFQIIVTVSLAVGAALGSVVIVWLDFHGIFIASAAGRLIAALLFVWLLTRRMPGKKPAPASVK